jgi:hypothetical protein
MILGVWQVLIVIGAGAAYHGFVRKDEGAVFTLLATTGIFAVCGLGALSLEAPHATSGEWGIAILCFVVASLGALALPVALTRSGPYGHKTQTTDNEQAELSDSEDDWLDELARRLS